MADIDPNRWPEVTPEWWSLVAGAAVAGAVLVPAHRVLAGAAAAAAAFALALYQLPCCAGCSAGATCGGATTGGGGIVKLGPPTPVGDTGVVAPGLIDPGDVFGASAAVAKHGGNCYA